MFNQVLTVVNGIIWHNVVILLLLAVGILFTIWSKFGQVRALSHGFKIIRGDFDSEKGDGAISHFQALSAALSATVGVGNIGGTALAISMGGPGALFWMWIVGLLGMALKTVEVTVTMLYRKKEGDQVLGGPMWVVDQGLKDIFPSFRSVAKFVAGLFCITLLIATFTGGLFFQAWNAANITQQFFGIPGWIVGLILAVIVGSVILGGIQRIGTVAGKIVPFMCTIYMLAALYAIGVHSAKIPSLIQEIFSSAFSSSSAQGAFLGGTFGAIFSIGMQRAFFSSEAGQGSSPIAHAAVKTDEPVREGVVAGLEPFIDTIVVCTLTGLVILLSGVWNRAADYSFESQPIFEQVAAADSDSKTWRLGDCQLPERSDREWVDADRIFVIATIQSEEQPLQQQVTGVISIEDGKRNVEWQEVASETQPVVQSEGFFIAYDGAALAAAAFNRSGDGLGKWLVTVATWLFGISTMISWSYYGEQGVTYLFGRHSVLIYRLLFCLAIFLSCVGLVQSRTELTNLSNLGTGVMLWVNIPITLLFAPVAMRHYHAYFAKSEESLDDERHSA